MADKRPGFRARHLIRQVFRNKNFNVRLTAFNELMHHLSKRHRKKMPAAPLSLKAPGLRVPMTGHARHLLRRLRKARAWDVVRRILAEIHREITKAHRRAVRIARAKARMRQAWKRAKPRLAAAGRWARRKAGRLFAWIGRLFTRRRGGSDGTGAPVARTAHARAPSYRARSPHVRTRTAPARTARTR